MDDAAAPLEDVTRQRPAADHVHVECLLPDREKLQVETYKKSNFEKPDKLRNCRCVTVVRCPNFAV